MGGVNLIWYKYTAKWVVQTVRMNFQTRPRVI